MSYFDRNPVGRLMTRMTTDVEVLQEMFAAGVMTLVADMIMLVWIVMIMQANLGIWQPGSPESEEPVATSVSDTRLP